MLESDATMLNEVVTTGFQTISRERNTGSAVIINSEKLDKIQAPNLTDKLEGMVTGLSSYGSSNEHPRHIIFCHRLQPATRGRRPSGEPKP